jgi:integrase
LTAGDITLEDATAFYAYRGKGGKRGRRELPRPVYEAICRTLADVGLELPSMAPDGSLWQAGAGLRGVSGGVLYGRFRRYQRMAGLPPSGLHILRHSARQGVEAEAGRRARGRGDPGQAVRLVVGQGGLGQVVLGLGGQVAEGVGPGSALQT